jgi:hypothetical protein
MLVAEHMHGWLGEIMSTLWMCERLPPMCCDTAYRLAMKRKVMAKARMK